MSQQLFLNRCKEVEEYQKKGKNPWPHKFTVTITVPEFKMKYEGL